jgi:hypothetical protein
MSLWGRIVVRRKVKGAGPSGVEVKKVKGVKVKG